MKTSQEYKKHLEVNWTYLTDPVMQEFIQDYGYLEELLVRKAKLLAEISVLADHQHIIKAYDGNPAGEDMAHRLNKIYQLIELQ